MGAVGDFMQLVLTSEFAGVECKNIFYYRVQTAGSATDLLNEWTLELFPKIQAITSTSVTYISRNVYNLNDLTDFDERQFGAGTDGDVVGDALPSFNAWGFKLNRTDRTTRNGAKRFVGVPESASNLGVHDGSLSTEIASLEFELSDLVQGAGTSVFQPIIYRSGTSTGNGVWNDVSSASYQRITSQNSRKA